MWYCYLVMLYDVFEWYNESWSDIWGIGIEEDEVTCEKLEFLDFGLMSIDWHPVSINCMRLILEKSKKMNYVNRLIPWTNWFLSAKTWKIRKAECNIDWCQSIAPICQSIDTSWFLKNYWSESYFLSIFFCHNFSSVSQRCRLKHWKANWWILGKCTHIVEVIKKIESIGTTSK